MAPCRPLYAPHYKLVHKGAILVLIPHLRAGAPQSDELRPSYILDKPDSQKGNILNEKYSAYTGLHQRSIYPVAVDPNKVLSHPPGRRRGSRSAGVKDRSLRAFLTGTTQTSAYPVADTLLNYVWEEF